MSPRLQALAQLYALAAHRRLRLRQRCDCWTAEAAEELRAVPIPALPWALVEVVLASCFASEEDFLACLPRLLELTRPATFDRERVHGRLRHALTSAAEDLALRAYLREEFLESLADPPRELLESILSLGLGDQVLELSHRPVAPSWFAELVCEIGRKRHAEGLSAREAMFADELLVAPRREAVERAFFAASTPAEQRLFSTALQVLEWFA